MPNIIIFEQDIRRRPEGGLDSARAAVPESDLPVSAEIVGAELIDTLGSPNVAALLHQTTSAVSTPAGGTAFNEIQLRGFENASLYRNGVNDSLGALPLRSLANVERIEVLKGPYGALFGPGEPGGSINFITKRPQTAPAHVASVSIGNYSEFALSLDSTGPIGARDDLQYRLIAVREQADSFRDFVKRDRVFANPALAWQPTADIAVEAAVEYIHHEQLLDSGVIAIGRGFPLPQARFLGEPAAGAADIDGLTLQTSSSLQLPHDLELNFSFNAQRTSLKARTVEGSELTLVNRHPMLSREAQNLAEDVNAMVAQLEARGRRSHGASVHHFVVGIEATAVNEKVVVFNSDSEVDAFAIDPFVPVYGQTLPALELGRRSDEKTRQYSLYAQDLLQLGEHWRLLLSARFDHISQRGSDIFSQSIFDNVSKKLSPRVGLVYKPIRSLSLFASYSQSIDPNEGLRPDGNSLSPTRGEGIEGGLKWEFAPANLAVEVAGFAIEQTNITREAPGDPGFEIQTAQQDSAGVDLEITLQPWAWASLVARYNYLDSEISNDLEVPSGTPALNVPTHRVNFLALANGSLRRDDDLTVGVALNYFGERQGSLEPEELDLTLPEYFRIDAFASWRYSKLLRFELRLENVSDEEFIHSSQSDALNLTPGTPFTVNFEIKATF